MYLTPTRPMEAVPAAEFIPSEIEIDVAAERIYLAFLEGRDPYSIEERIVEEMVPLLIQSVRACTDGQVTGDGGLELSPGSELVWRAAKSVVGSWDAETWAAWNGRRS